MYCQDQPGYREHQSIAYSTVHSMFRVPSGSISRAIVFSLSSALDAIARTGISGIPPLIDWQHGLRGAGYGSRYLTSIVR